jgi:hypothetical protein
MFRFDYFFARWNLSNPPNQSSIQAGPAGASKRSLIMKTRREIIHPWAAYIPFRSSFRYVSYVLFHLSYVPSVSHQKI